MRNLQNIEKFLDSDDEEKRYKDLHDLLIEYIKMFKNTTTKLDSNVFFFRNACQIESVPR